MTKLTVEKRTSFLSVLADGASVSQAALSIDVKRPSLYAMRNKDQEFREDWDDAVEAGTDCLEDEAVRRARESSDVLLIFMLKARRPDRFRERSTVDVNVTSDLAGRIETSRKRTIEG